MNALTMIIPTRSRPAAAIAAARSAIDNATLPGTRVLLAVDGCCSGDGGPADHDAYEAAAGDRIYVALSKAHRGMVATLNVHARYHCADPEVTHLGFMGDDHRVRTPGWDAALTEAAGPWGVSYGDDLIQREALPTAVVMSVGIVRILGRMGPVELRHLYIDNYWKALGEGIHALTYVPSVVLEHLHPSVGKAKMDASYEITSSPESYAADLAAWTEFQDTGILDADIRAIVHRGAP